MESDKEIFMEFEPVLEKIDCSSRKKNLFDQIKFDCKGEVDAQNITSILNVSSWVVISETKVETGQISYGGKANFYVCYLDLDSKLCKTECAVEFKGNIKDDSVCEEDKIIIDAIVDKYSYDLSGAYLTLNGYISVKAQVEGNCSVGVIVGGEDLVVNQREFSFVKNCGVKKANYPLEEEFILSYPVQEVLSHRAEAIITAVQCGVGCIIVDGEVLLSAIMLQKNDNNDIIKETNSIPYRMEIECEECMPSMQAIARVKEKSFKIDITVDPEKNQSVMRASVSLAFQGEAFYFENLNIAEDLFCTQKEIEISHANINYSLVKEMKHCYSNFTGRVSVQELPIGCVLLALIDEQCEVLKVECDNQTKITGTIFATAILRDNEGKIFTIRLETPFESQLDILFEQNINLSVCGKVKSSKARIVSLTETEIDCELYFTIYPEEKNQVRVIDQVKLLGDKIQPTSAISVYIPTRGEELWSLAKRLNQTPEKLIETNPELQFPLEGNERIVVYRQK